MNRLTDKQLQSYRDQGFVLLGTILDPPQLAVLQAEELRFRGYCQLSLDDKQTVLPDGATLFRNQLGLYSAVVRDFVTHGPHLTCLQQLIGPNLCGWFNQFVTKMPEPDLKKAEFPWHQDNGYADVDPPTNLTVWCALVDTDKKNGCIWVIPGSHKLGLLPHKGAGASWHQTVQTTEEGIPVRLRAGEAVAFSGCTLHRSKQNLTNRPRPAFFMQYADAQATLGKGGSPVMSGPNAFLVSGQIPYPLPEGFVAK